MIKRYNQFVNDRINENVENEETMDFNKDPIDDFNDQTGDFDNVDNPINDFNDGDYVDDFNDDVDDFSSGEEEEDDDDEEYTGTLKMEQLADELGVDMREDGSINYNGVEIHFYSEDEKFHIDKMVFTTVEEVINYLENGELQNNSDLESETQLPDDMNIKESYRRSRFDRSRRWK